MAKYRKKPVVIEAWEFDGIWTSVQPIVEGNRGISWCSGPPAYCEIKTLEGVMRADVGDWIIRGVKGEFYPCKPDIFAATYDPAE